MSFLAPAYVHSPIRNAKPIGARDTRGGCESQLPELSLDRPAHEGMTSGTANSPQSSSFEISHPNFFTKINKSIRAFASL